MKTPHPDQRTPLTETELFWAYGVIRIEPYKHNDVRPDEPSPWSDPAHPVKEEVDPTVALAHRGAGEHYPEPRAAVNGVIHE